MATYRKRGDRWHVQIRRKDHPSLTRSFDRKVDADRWVRKTERQIDVGDFSLVDPTIAKEIKLEMLLIRYAGEVTVDKRGCDPEQYRLNALSRCWICNYTLDRLTPQIISKYRDERLKLVAPSTVLKELQLLGHILQVAQRDWGVPITPSVMDDVVLPKASCPRDKRLEPGELQRLLQGCEQGRSPLLAPVIEFAIETAMRRGEIVKARWNDVDWDTGTMLIPVTKNGSRRTIPLTARAMAIIILTTALTCHIPATASATGEKQRIFASYIVFDCYLYFTQTGQKKNSAEVFNYFG